MPLVSPDFPMPRFALLRHDVPADFGRPSHWDLLIEQADDCAAWSLEALPKALGGDADVVSATELPPHRKHYLEYSGPVGGGRGNVRQVLAGTCRASHPSTEQWQVAIDIAGRVVTLSIELRDGAWLLTAE